LRGPTNIPGTGNNNTLSQVNGREDLINYFPLYLDIAQLVKFLPPSEYSYQLSQADAAVNVVYTDLKPAQVGGFLTNTNTTGSLYDNTSALATASKVHVLPSGVPIDESWINSIGDTNSAGGVILIDGVAKTTNPLVLSVTVGSQQVASIQFPLSIDKIGNMYRWVNLRGATGGSTAVSSKTNIPSNYPDTYTDNKMVIFVHGYNVSETQSTAWFAEAFKRLYQSGAKSMFTGIAWNGNMSQTALAGGNTPNYWINVDNAFGTVAALSNAVSSLPGTNKIIIAHSLGNMLVSSAINDLGINVSNYFMLDAAMPTEGFDQTTFGNLNMIFTGANSFIDGITINIPDPGWKNYNNNLWASYWYSLFTTSDGRYKLTWKGRFTNVGNVVNFYSTGEEVLNNPSSGTVGNPGAELAWADQELSKGTLLQGIASGVGYIGSRGQARTITQGGWGFNSTWESTSVQPTGDYNYIPKSPQSANNLTTNQLQTNPFFTPFSDSNLTGPNGSAEASRYTIRAKVLGEAIPALSYAVGRNSVGAFGPENQNNFDMVNLEDGWPQERKANQQHRAIDWFHGDSKDVAYPFTHRLWESFVKQGQLN